jgi:hypothetical protein
MDRFDLSNKVALVTGAAGMLYILQTLNVK